ncbi:co-chaperone YbbN [Rathayibacter sp. AY1C2]|uniref:tetratricopeptide repeat protein n=1 Tax=unclassified Rathayibacter TaxID=2609250 RepID=UPI000CE88289|nr:MULTISPECIES: tetratricopeptide repeat protein [unclassified Rathayibacter]PPF59532.1 co-chaperone YbbN [Rathayibacter sp. AY1C2]PPG62739.1 co-chaperone YbbN [Rathayibacter sp. AY1C7]PPG91512.1 co-chaperone YbbN [Rathayibacter sp. AY1F3]PPH55639.1 co-chaperone YbbN [Rathayibacter sp. AY1E1]QHF20121.1 tetratricopeptide repeat protein [Rathayibacter sp. VKM Ac-2762]
MSTVPPLPGNLRGAVDLSSLVNRRTPPAASAGAPAAPAAPGGAPGANPLLLTAGDAEFDQVVQLSSRVPVIVDLRGSWSDQSQSMTALLEKVVVSYAGAFVLVGVDVESSPQLAQAFQVQSVPTVAAIIGGRPVPLFSGLVAEEQLRDLLEQVLQLAAQNGVTGTVPVEGAAPAEGAEPEPEPLPPHHQEAYDAIDRGDYAAAITEYETAIAQNPRDDLAVAGLAQVRLLARLQGRTLDDIRSTAAAEPSNLDAQLAVADLDVSGGHVEDAFDRLLSMFPRLDAEGKAAVRARLLELFEIVGQTDPRVNKARARLTGLLY